MRVTYRSELKLDEAVFQYIAQPNYIDNNFNFSAKKVSKMDRYKQPHKSHHIRNILFIGDSLTEKRNKSSYTWFVANHLAHRYGGYAQIGYLPFSSYRTKYDIGNINIKNHGFREMYGESDHKWNSRPYNFSPDGKGWYVERATGNEQIVINLGNGLRFNKLRIYALCSVNGGNFRVSLPNTGGDANHQYNTESLEDKVKAFEVKPNAAEGFETITIDDLQEGGDYYFYGIEILDNTNIGGITYNIFARNGSFARDFANLSHINTYIGYIKPQLVLINLGTNDALRGRSVEQYIADLESLIRQVRKGSLLAQICLVEPNPTILNDSNEAMKLFTLARKELAKSQRLQYIDVPKLVGSYDFFEKSSYLQKDQVHLTEEGKRIVAKAILQELNVPATYTSLYYPSQKDFSHSHEIRNLGRTKKIASRKTIKLFDISLVGDRADSVVSLRFTSQSLGVCIVKQVDMYLYKHKDKSAKTLVGNIVVKNVFQSPRFSIRKVDIILRQEGSSVSFYIRPKYWSISSWTINGTYTTNLRVPKNSGLLLNA